MFNSHSENHTTISKLVALILDENLFVNKPADGVSDPLLGVRVVARGHFRLHAHLARSDSPSFLSEREDHLRRRDDDRVGWALQGIKLVGQRRHARRLSAADRKRGDLIYRY